MTSVEHPSKGAEQISVVKRARQSQWPAIPMEKALDLIEKLGLDFPPESKCVPVAALQTGRILAEKIYATEDVPQARTSIKDGYAVIASDTPAVLKVVGFSTAGAPYTEKLKMGECVRVSTGGVVPEGADAVIQVEDTTLEKYEGDTELEVKFLKGAKMGQDIRERGSDVKKDDLLLDIGCEMASAEIGLLNAFGIQHVEIYRKPRVCVLSTGNELVESYNYSLPLGHIRDSNRPQLISLFKSQGFKAIDAGIACDTMEAIEYAIHVAAQFSSVIVTSGGVSMGEKDHLKEVLQKKLMFEILFGRVWMKPGLPCTVAHGEINEKKVVVFALPGNPVSSWVCSHLFASPLLRHMAGHTRTRGTVIKVKLANDVNLGIRPEYCRAWVEFKPEDSLPIATVTGNQISSRLMSLVGAHVLLILPSNNEKPKLEAGDVVDAIVVAGL